MVPPQRELPPHLTEEQAKESLELHGPNELPHKKDEGIIGRILQLFREPMIILLILAAALYLMMGDLGEGLLLSFSVGLVIALSLYQEIKSERALEALRELSSPRALVIRNDEEKRIPARFLVPDDLIVLREGDRIPADGQILQSNNISVDESLLTGEAEPVLKGMGDPVYSSTLCVRGSALVRLTKTGPHTEVGKIGKSLALPEPELMNLGKEINSLVHLFAWVGGITCILIVVLYGMTRGNWPEAFLVGLATQMSLLPEEFPVILTIFMALGAWRLSRVKVLVRKPRSIERLGAISALCVDKTGTLTENRMTVVTLSNWSATYDLKTKGAAALPEEFHEIAEYGVLASHVDPFDPMEKAILRLLHDSSWGEEHRHNWEILKEYPLSDKLLAMSCVWNSSQNQQCVVATKGAPEAVIELCHLTPEDSTKILSTTQALAARGQRVLGVAKAKLPPHQFPTIQHDIDFEWVGLIGLEDPLRKEVPQAVKTCREGGVRVIMMTGDYPETAIKIANEAGLDTSAGVLTGKELSAMDELQLKKALNNGNVFARMIPEQKLKIVETLQSLGHTVAMTGDGVNDAPSLKFADVGIAMGARGTDVAREASDLVLLDDNFASIIAGIRRGRTIFSNIRRAMAYIVSVHVPIAGLAFLPVLLEWPLILMPAHIVFLQLIIDPAGSLLFESQAQDKNIMKSPPRSLKTRLFSPKDLGLSFLQGFLVLILCVIAYLWSLESAADEDRARAVSFIFLIFCNVGLILGDLTAGSLERLWLLMKRPLNWLILFFNFLILALTLLIPGVRELFGFALPGWTEVHLAFLAGGLVFIILFFSARFLRR